VHPMSPLTPTPRGSATEQSTYCDCMQRLSLRGFCLLQPRNWILERRRRLGCSSKTLLSAQRLDSLHAGLALEVLHAKANERPTGTDQPGDPCSETVHEVLGQYHIQSNSRVELLAIVNLDCEQRRRLSSYNSYQRRLHADQS